MKTSVKIAERFASMIIGTALAVTGSIFIVLGLTIFPVIGVLIGVPVMGLAFGCFRSNAWTIAVEGKTGIESEIPESLAA